MDRVFAEPVTYFAGWTLIRIAECDSTNDYARDMGEWTAVSAQCQKQGRGRYGRVWHSNEGGVWVSAVVPAPITEEVSRLMPLAAGLAVADTLTAYGINDVRFRWPNDVMIQGKKCAGILVDRFHADRCVVGIGINVWNDPVRCAPELAGSVTRMHDWLPDCPDSYEVTVRILAALRNVIKEVQKQGPTYLIQHLRQYWSIGQRVEIEINGRKGAFDFCGVDTRGAVMVSGQGNRQMSFAAEEITLFREL